MKDLVYMLFVGLILSLGVHQPAYGKSLFPAADQVVEIAHNPQELEAKWRGRIQAFLQQGVKPIIDLQSSLKHKDAKNHIKKSLPVMDKLGIALIAFDGYQGKKSKSGKKYHWGYDIHNLVNHWPDRFILASNGGTNKNWLKQRNHFISQLEEQTASGDYRLIGELDFRHYMSNSQCKKNKTGRDSYISLTSKIGRRVFRLAEKNKLPVSIHFEMEDQLLAELEATLNDFPDVPVIVAHFGQIRQPRKQTKFGPELIEKLFTDHANLYFDISGSDPGRRYRCNDVLDTVFWQNSGAFAGQVGSLKAEYLQLLNRHSDRFVIGYDYGGGRGSLSRFLEKKTANIRKILSQLSEEANHNIAYRNAWRLLTGKNF
jgi:hypothetical protein